MDTRLVELCFGTPEVPADVDLADEESVLDHHVAAMGAHVDDDDELGSGMPYAGTRAAVRAIVTNQLLGAEPFEPAVSAAERLLDAGYDRDATLRQLCAVMLRALQASMPEVRRGMPTVPGEDDEVALANLLPIDVPLDELYGELPVPTAGQVRDTMRSVIAGEQGISSDELERTVAATLGHDGREIVEEMASRTIDEFMGAGMVMLYPDRVVDPATLFGDHDPTSPDAGDPSVEIDPELADLVRRCYELEHDEGRFAIDLPSLAAAVALARPGTWSAPHPPLRDLVTAAGLEIRRGMAAGDEGTWRQDYMHALLRQIDPALDDDQDAGRRARHAVADLFGDLDEPPRLGRSTVAAFRDPDIGPVLADAIGGAYAAEPEWEREAAETLASLRDHATRDAERAIAVWLTSIAHERRGEFAEAEQQIHEAVRLDPDHGPAVERAGWYAFLRGDAVAARRAWAQVGWSLPRERSLADRFGSGSSVDLGRNDPCWCGSGRKYKACHLGQPRTPDDAERAAWLWAKAVGFLTRSGDDGIGDVADLCGIRAADPSDPASIQAAFNDPLVLDTALFELGWMDRFVDLAGDLLPPGEYDLLDEWTHARRDLFRVERIEGDVVVLSRLDGDLEIRLAESLPGRQPTVGEHWCIRPLRVGERWYAPGGALRLDEDELDDANDALEDPFGFCEWLAEVRPLR